MASVPVFVVEEKVKNIFPSFAPVNKFKKQTCIKSLQTECSFLWRFEIFLVNIVAFVGS